MCISYATNNRSSKFYMTIIENKTEVEGYKFHYCDWKKWMNELLIRLIIYVQNNILSMSTLEICQFIIRGECSITELTNWRKDMAHGISYFIYSSGFQMDKEKIPGLCKHAGKDF